MGLSQGNFDRAVRSGEVTLRELLEHRDQRGAIDLTRTNTRRLQTLHHDLEQIQTAIRMELLNRAEYHG
jgi:hypothetical protein